MNKIEDKELFNKAKQFYTNKDYQKAFDIYNDLASAGSVSSQRFIGWMHYLGEGVKEDISKAEFWMEKAANENDIEAQFGLGKIYTRKGDYEKSVLWYRKSSDGGFTPAIYRLGMMYLFGKGVDQDVKVSIELFKTGYEKKHIHSGMSYAKLLLKGSNGILGSVRGALIYMKMAVSIFITVATDINSKRLMR